MDIEILKQKKEQIPGILKEYGIDMWLTYVRESDTLKDPALDLFLDRGVTWQTAFIFTKDGYDEVILGSLDKDNIESSGLFSNIKTYVASINETLRESIAKIDPKKIAINRSENDVMADGLTCGMFSSLTEALKGTPYVDRFVSSEDIISALRGRKNDAEIKNIQKAIDITEDIYHTATVKMKSGMTENDIAEIIRSEFRKYGVVPSWDAAHCPGIFVGCLSAEAHAAPSDIVIEKGMVVHADFGVKYDGYCSDIQRTWYILKDGQTKAPEIVQKAFDVLYEAIQRSALAVKPGVEGRVIDKIAREYIIENGFGDFPHALGHQVGRSTHDGSGLFCPEWERYGNRPYTKIEKGQVYTIEPRITLEGYGVVTMEEMILVTDDGAKFLSKVQKELFLI